MSEPRPIIGLTGPNAAGPEPRPIIGLTGPNAAGPEPRPIIGRTGPNAAGSEPRLIFGLTGPNAAGKGEVAARLIAAGFAYHSLSDVLRDELESAGLAPTRENLIAKGNELRARHGAGVLAERVRRRLGGRDIVDSIRNPAEVAALRQEKGFVLVGVDAPQEVRFRRARERARPGDAMTFEEFQSKEARENSPDPREQQLARTWDLADHVLRNDGPLPSLHDAVDALLHRLSAGR